MTLNAVYALTEHKHPKELIKAAFELRTACQAGYEPSLDGCGVCGTQMPDRFDVTQGCLFCSTCRPTGVDGICLPVSAAVLSAMRYITFCPDKRLFSFVLPQAELVQLNYVTEAYLCSQLEHSFYTLDFYKSLLLT